MYFNGTVRHIVLTFGEWCRSGEATYLGLNPTANQDKRKVTSPFDERFESELHHWIRCPWPAIVSFPQVHREVRPLPEVQVTRAFHGGRRFRRVCEYGIGIKLQLDNSVRVHINQLFGQSIDYSAPPKTWTPYQSFGLVCIKPIVLFIVPPRVPPCSWRGKTLWRSAWPAGGRGSSTGVTSWRRDPRGVCGGDAMSVRETFCPRSQGPKDKARRFVMLSGTLIFVVPVDIILHIVTFVLVHMRGLSVASVF